MARIHAGTLASRSGGFYRKTEFGEAHRFTPA